MGDDGVLSVTMYAEDETVIINRDHLHPQRINIPFQHYNIVFDDQVPCMT